MKFTHGLQTTRQTSKNSDVLFECPLALLFPIFQVHLDGLTGFESREEQLFQLFNCMSLVLRAVAHFALFLHGILGK